MTRLIVAAAFLLVAGCESSATRPPPSPDRTEPPAETGVTVYGDFRVGVVRGL